MARKGPDERDMKILDVLRVDARASVREISRRTDIRPSTVHQRMMRMSEEGIIEGFTVRVNDEMLGEGFTVFMLVSGTSEKYLDKKVIGDPHIKEIHGITGEYDLLIKLKFKDLREFNRFIVAFREKYSRYITKTLTMVQTAKVKEV